VTSLWHIQCGSACCSYCPHALLLLLQIIKACALVGQAEVVTWVRRLQCLLATYIDDYLNLCKARKQQQQPASSSLQATGKPPKPLLLPAAAKSGIKAWFRYQLQQQQQQPGAAAAAVDASDAAAGPAGGGRGGVVVDPSAAALSQMKYFLLNAPLAARVCMASSDSQVRTDWLGKQMPLARPMLA
jgi:hypothetical protein